MATLITSSPYHTEPQPEPNHHAPPRSAQLRTFQVRCNKDTKSKNNGHKYTS